MRELHEALIPSECTLTPNEAAPTDTEPTDASSLSSNMTLFSVANSQLLHPALASSDGFPDSPDPEEDIPGVNMRKKVVILE